MRFLNPGETVVSRPQSVKARDDHLYEEGGKESHGIDIALQGKIGGVAHVDAGVPDRPAQS
jgi:hypothetical protein